MTIVACPHGCGGYVDTAKEDYCTSCRRPLNVTEIVIPEDWDEDRRDEELADGVCMVARKASWCWQWWGPADHRMRCRRPKDHEGDHDTRESRVGPASIIATNGDLIALL